MTLTKDQTAVLNKPEYSKLKNCYKGAKVLRAYRTLSIIICVVWFFFFIQAIRNGTTASGVVALIVTALLAVCSMSIVYFAGMIKVMFSSTQVSIKSKTIAYILAWLFPINLGIIARMIKTAEQEVDFETNKILLNSNRYYQQVCRTRYPILMVHGVFFRDFKPAFLNYWGRISDELIYNGAKVYFGNQQSAASVEECGAEIAARIRQIVLETGCEKVNIIAHSKGGLDSRAAIARYGVEDMVASLTTINTPHRGCEFADYLLGKIGQGVKDTVAATYNNTLHKLGDSNPNFIEAVTDLTHEACENFNLRTPDSPKVYYQSVGSYMPKASDGKFPLNFSYHLVKLFDGRNDGLVGEKSFPWGQNFIFLEPKSGRGISHGDMIDLNRENIDGFDVREFYVQLVSDLKNKGF
ncbi:MAG: triacylglycerol lipase [Butyrivibrio sp.]|nr:triacylglycerol lipase [Butyrivibrio sp.]